MRERVREKKVGSAPCESGRGRGREEAEVEEVAVEVEVVYPPKKKKKKKKRTDAVVSEEEVEDSYNGSWRSLDPFGGGILAGVARDRLHLPSEFIQSPPWMGRFTYDSSVPVARYFTVSLSAAVTLNFIRLSVRSHENTQVY